MVERPLQSSSDFFEDSIEPGASLFIEPDDEDFEKIIDNILGTYNIY